MKGTELCQEKCKNVLILIDFAAAAAVCGYYHRYYLLVQIGTKLVTISLPAKIAAADSN